MNSDRDLFTNQYSLITNKKEMKNKVLYTLALSILFTGITLFEANASGRTGLYSPQPVEKVESTSSNSAESGSSGLYSPLRANPTSSGVPTPDEGIGVGTPIGDATGLILLAGMAYLGFVFLRKRRTDLQTQ